MCNYCYLFSFQALKTLASLHCNISKARGYFFLCQCWQNGQIIRYIPAGRDEEGGRLLQINREGGRLLQLNREGGKALSGSLHQGGKGWDWVHCAALRCTTLPGFAMHCTRLHYITLHCTELHYSALECTDMPGAVQGMRMLESWICETTHPLKSKQIIVPIPLHSTTALYHCTLAVQYTTALP